MAKKKEAEKSPKIEITCKVSSDKLQKLQSIDSDLGNAIDLVTEYYFYLPM